MLLAGQNKYSKKTVEETTQYWLDLGINHIMIKKAGDIQLIDSKSRLIEADFRKLGSLQEKYGVKVHIHPYNFIINNIFLTPALKEAHSTLERFLIDLDTNIQKYDLYPLITVHAAKYSDPNYQFWVDEKTALKNSIDFFQSLDLKSRLAIETMHEPDANPGHSLLGYKAEHFPKLIGDKNYGICIDVGHTKMAEEPIEALLALPYPIFSVHLHGNDGSRDQHLLPTKDNVGDFNRVIEALRRCEGPIVLELGNHSCSKNEVKDCINFWTKAVCSSAEEPRFTLTA